MSFKGYFYAGLGEPVSPPPRGASPYYAQVREDGTCHLWEFAGGEDGWRKLTKSLARCGRT